MRIREIFNTAILKLTPLSKCAVGGSYFHKKFESRQDSTDVILELIKKSDTTAYCRWYEPRWPDLIKGNLELPLSYEVLVASQEVKKGMPLICDSCKKKTSEVVLDIRAGLSNCLDCTTGAHEKKRITGGVAGSLGTGKLITVRISRDKPAGVVSRAELNVDFKGYQNLQGGFYEKYAALSCITDSKVIGQIIELEKQDGGSKLRLKHALKCLKRLTSR